MKVLKYVLVLGAFLGIVCFFGVVLAGVFGKIDSNHAVAGGIVFGAASVALIFLSALAIQDDAAISPQATRKGRQGTGG
jgi:Na+/proline symporter